MDNERANSELPTGVGLSSLPTPVGLPANEPLREPLYGGESPQVSDSAATHIAGFTSSESPGASLGPQPEPAPESDRLKEAGEQEAHCWQAPGKDQGPWNFKERWLGASQSIRAVLKAAKPQAPEEAASNLPETELLNNRRLIEAALAGTRDLFRTVQNFPAVATGEGPVVARAYAAVGAYLRMSCYDFQVSAFVPFLLGVQEVYPLRMREVWALKALCQVVLLERIGQAARSLTGRDKDPVKAAETASGPALEIPSYIASLRALELAAWKEIGEEIGVVNGILRGDPCGAYPRMDAESRHSYLQALDQLGRYSEMEEAEIAHRALALARLAQFEWNTNLRVKERRSHVGFFLVGEGRPLLERHINYRPPLPERLQKAVLAWPEIYYFVGIELLTFGIIAFLLIGARAPVSLIAALILLCLPVTEAAWGMMNQLTVSFLPPKALPKLDFSEGIPNEHSTLVVVPTLLTGEAYVRRLVGDLEIRFLANRDTHLYFALLTDAPDSPQPQDPSDGLVTLCSNLIEELNAKYSGHGKSSFFLFHRFRTFNPSEGAWMGWERKRGKLLDLNGLLRGEKDNFPVKVGNLSVLPQIKYVIVVDSDTQLPRGVARRLVAAMAHPLNRAVINPATNTVVEGHGILQPRVGISVQSASRSLLAAIYSGQTGFDMYTRAVSDVYQDLFGEGTFAGKGIYEVDVFRQVLGKRFPCNAILSHDLIEGTYTRAGLVSDVEVIDDYPTHFGAYSRRKHRWVRGDWQIMHWLLPRVPDATGVRVPNPLSLLSRWKIFDNLRRSLVEIATFVLLLAGWLSLPGSPRRWTLVVIVLMLIPVYLQMALSLLRIWSLRDLPERLGEILDTFVTGQINVFFTLAFLSHQTLVMLDAIVRTIVRVTITRRKLLEWETAAQAEVETSRTPVDMYLSWTPWLSLVIGGVVAICRPSALPAAAPLLILWACAGPLARWLNRPLHPAIASLSHKEEDFLRSASLRTWRFFREASTERDHNLIPDNIQEMPRDIAHRLSPTNLGLHFNSQLAAFELGFLALPEFVCEAEKTLETAKRLPRFRGHFFNWYDTESLQPLEPRFVSSVDSGNLVCSLWTLKQGCLKAIQEPVMRPAIWQGLYDHINLLEELASQAPSLSRAAGSLRRICAQIELLPEQGSARVCALPGLAQDLREVLGRVEESAQPADELRWWTAETIRRAEAIQDMVDQLLPGLSPHNRSLLNQLPNKMREETSFLTLRALEAVSADLDGELAKIAEHSATSSNLGFAARALRKRLPGAVAEAERLQKKLAKLAEDAGQLVQEMDFRFLYNPSRGLLSIGYDLGRGQADLSCYDLLASEARSAVFAAIAKGDVPQEAWFHLERPQACWKGENTLLSWSGTMFEYLMPALWFEHRPRTLLGETIRAAVRCQMAWAGSAIPWGISEAAFSAQDPTGHYQYQAFGVPPLALSNLSPGDCVVAPYATCLALSVDPRAAIQNLQRMKDRNWLGTLGFYDAADFTPSRAPHRGGCTLVHSWMAHHQGMSLLAACNVLTGDALHKLFHAEPAVRATELLLHEKPLRATRCEERLNGAVPFIPPSFRGNDHEA